jgi:hypothetical protein
MRSSKHNIAGPVELVLREFGHDTESSIPGVSESVAAPFGFGCAGRGVEGYVPKDSALRNIEGCVQVMELLEE